jgi:hypothetical protein
LSPPASSSAGPEADQPEPGDPPDTPGAADQADPGDQDGTPDGETAGEQPDAADGPGGHTDPSGAIDRLLGGEAVDSMSALLDRLLSIQGPPSLCPDRSGGLRRRRLVRRFRRSG